jgi:hypothetical protein
LSDFSIYSRLVLGDSNIFLLHGQLETPPSYLHFLGSSGTWFETWYTILRRNSIQPSILTVFIYLGINNRHQNFQATTLEITKKLAGFATAFWATSMGNEHGQIINMLLTAQEGIRIDEMVQGIMARNKNASISPPDAIYVDHDCCSN